ncbi:MAG: hypothetical protein Q9181_002544 [Wetmoreana brouardii]
MFRSGQCYDYQALGSTHRVVPTDGPNDTVLASGDGDQEVEQLEGETSALSSKEQSCPLPADLSLSVGERPTPRYHNLTVSEQDKRQGYSDDGSQRPGFLETAVALEQEAAIAQEKVSSAQDKLMRPMSNFNG